jgi:hypothetical protein
MTSHRKCEEHPKTVLSHLDLKQIKEAVRELRASSPRSALADLVEEKIRLMENDDLMPPHGFSKPMLRWSIN